jgi:hypothetical protein
MKGTILEFLKLAAEKPEVARELAELAAKHGIDFSELTDEELEAAAGGVVDKMVFIPTPTPNMGDGGSGLKFPVPDGMPSSSGSEAGTSGGQTSQKRFDNGK